MAWDGLLPDGGAPESGSYMIAVQLKNFWGEESGQSVMSLHIFSSEDERGENMLDLCKKAQKSLHTYFADNLPWGRKYAATLNTPFRPGLLWKDVVYTDHFTEKQTAYWSERMHIYATDSTVAYVKARKELFRDVTSFDSPIKSIILAMQKEGNYDTSNQR